VQAEVFLDDFDGIVHFQSLAWHGSC